MHRLRVFVAGFYNSGSQPAQQNLDDSFQNFVWSTLSRLPSVKVGLVPLGQHVDVYIPPSARKKEDGQEEEHAGLEEIPDASKVGLARLVEEHGDRLRIAVDSERCFVAITGSHVRVCCLTTCYFLFSDNLTAQQVDSNGIRRFAARIAFKREWYQCPGSRTQPRH